MIFNRETDVCYGRSFDEGPGGGGFLENFYNWVTRPAEASPTSKVDGGPGWYIIDDQSAASPDPYIVVSNHTAANVASSPNRSDEPHKIIKIGMVGTEAGYIRIQTYLWWDSSAHAGYGAYGGFRLNTYDSAQFAYDFRGGPEMMIIQNRRGTTWDTYVLEEWVGDVNLVDGTHVRGTLQAGITAGNNVVIQLAAGEGAYFTEGHYAYLYDWGTAGAGHNWCNYVKIEAVDSYNDIITIDHCNVNFPIGSVVGAYVPRFITMCNRPYSANYFNSSYPSTIPFVSSYGYECDKGTARIYGTASGSNMSQVCNAMKPTDRNSEYAHQRPVVVEYRRFQDESPSEMNRAYGPLRHIYTMGDDSFAPAQDGLIINTLDYLHFLPIGHIFRNAQGDSLFPDYDSIV